MSDAISIIAAACPADERAAQIEALRAEFAGCADEGQVSELLRLVTDALEPMREAFDFLNSLSEPDHGPLMAQFVWFMGQALGNFRGVRDTIRAARRRANAAMQVHHQDAKDAKEGGR